MQPTLATLRRLHESRPSDRTVLARIDALCERAGRWPELADVLLREIAAAAREVGLSPVASTRSPITGAKGNVEFLLHLRP